MNTEREIRRDLGWLTYGVILGALIGLCINLWTTYYFKWFETTFNITDWMPIMITTTIALAIVIGSLLYYALRMLGAGLRMKPSEERSQVGFFHVMNLSDLDREEFRHTADRNLTLAGFALTALSIVVGFYRENLSDALSLITLLLSSMLLFFLASQMAYEAERLWHGFSADVLHYVGVVMLMVAFTYFINVKIQSLALTYLSILFVIIIVLYALKAIYNLYRFYRDYSEVHAREVSEQNEQKKKEV